MRSAATTTALISTAFLAVTSAAHAQRGNPQLSFAGQSIDDMVAEFMLEHDVPGLSLAIVQAPYVTRASAYGLSDPATARLVSPHTVFRVDGLARAYTAVGVMQLVEMGKLALDEPVRARIPGAPEDLTVRQLVGRRPSVDATRLLRHLIERASGTSYEAFVKTHQIERLGLERTVFASDLAALRNEPIVAGSRHRGFLRDAALIDPTETASGNPPGLADTGTLYASAADVSVWDIALAGELLIRDPALRKLLYEPPHAADGTSAATSGPWDFPGHRGLMVVSGSGGGFSSLLSRFTDPSELVCVTILTNKAGLDLSQLARRIAGAYDPRLGPPTRAARLRVQQSPYSVAETKGRFVSIARDQGAPPAFDAEVWQEGDEVWIAAADPVAVERGHAEYAAQSRRRAAVDAALLAAVSP
jgi:D-alanyl-D-alanine carboxypeptidase